MKNASRSKFLLCFRPVDVDMEMVVESKSARKARTKMIENTRVEKTEVVDKEQELKIVQAPLTKTMSLDRECSIIRSQSSKSPRSRHSRTLSKAFKAVVFETILAKKVRDGKAFRQDSFGSKRSYSLRLGTEKLMTIPSEHNSHEVRVNSDSEKQSLKKNQEDSVKKSKKNEKGLCELNSGMCVLLISLGVTVFWGRVLAILLTSIWLYFFSWRRANSNLRRPEKVRNLSEVESREQKRRVIMEGLIERNHHCHSSQRWH